MQNFLMGITTMCAFLYFGFGAFALFCGIEWCGAAAMTAGLACYGFAFTAAMIKDEGAPDGEL